MDKNVIAIIVGVAILLGGVVMWNVYGDSRKEETGMQVSGSDLENNGTVYFYGETCPHCADVMAYISENDIDEKVDFEKKEVWNNADNHKEFIQAAKRCGIDPRDVGVPFVFSEGKCYIGGPSVKNFFKNKAGI